MWIGYTQLRSGMNGSEELRGKTPLWIHWIAMLFSYVFSVEMVTRCRKGPICESLFLHSWHCWIAKLFQLLGAGGSTIFIHPTYTGTLLFIYIYRYVPCKLGGSTLDVSCILAPSVHFFLTHAAGESGNHVISCQFRRIWRYFIACPNRHPSETSGGT